MNDVFRLAVFEDHGYAAGLVRRIDLNIAGVDGERVELPDGVAAWIVATDAAEDDGMIAEAASHDGEVRGSAP